jgi:cell division protein FtsW
MFKKMIRNYDYTLIIASLFLIGLGLIMVYSSSYAVALNYDLQPGHFFKRQLFAIFVGLIIFIATLLFPYKAYQKFTKLLLLLTVSLLLIVLFVGEVVNNAQSWIRLGGFNFQPAELAKITIIIYLANVYKKKEKYIFDLNRAIIPPLVVVLIISILILKQPDFGSMLILVAIAGIITICTGTTWKNIVVLMLPSLILGAIFLKFFASNEQLSRFQGAYNPFAYPDDGYQLINSYVAMASGGITGRGLGESIQKFGFLPESQTDFIIAIIAEELGLIGVIVIILTLLYIVIRGFFIGMRCKDTFGSLLAFGISGMIGVQSFINLGAACGLLPITGVPLPLISYGGSSLITMLLSLGILINVSSFAKLQNTQNLNQIQTKAIGSN